MKKMTGNSDLFDRISPHKLIEQYGTPLYVYSEKILRQNCRKLQDVFSSLEFTINYSIKANSNPALLEIIRTEGLSADAMSPGEIYLATMSGFKTDQIFYITNNSTDAELCYAMEQGILISVDSLDQLRLLCRLNPGGTAALRINTGIGAGHHQKVITCGENSKFGIRQEELPTALQIAADHRLKITGINHHIGSLFLTETPYLDAAEKLLDLASALPDLEFIDFGGGFGIPYRPDLGEMELDIPQLGRNLKALIRNWSQKHNRKIKFFVEPGRYIAASSGVLIGKVTSVKKGNHCHWIGSDLGFNNFQRSVMYGSYHRISIKSILPTDEQQVCPCIFTGNICESGDLLSEVQQQVLPENGDLLIVHDAGAYGYAMCSNYNGRLRPAEVLICADGSVKLIRKRETLASLMLLYPE